LQKAQKRPTRLKRLRITDVSSVDRGAGVGVRVMLAKRDGGDMDREEEIKPMSTIEKSERFKRAFDDAVDAYVAKHGCPRAGAVEVVSMSPEVSEFHRLEQVSKGFWSSPVEYTTEGRWPDKSPTPLPRNQAMFDSDYAQGAPWPVGMTY